MVVESFQVVHFLHCLQKHILVLCWNRVLQRLQASSGVTVSKRVSETDASIAYRPTLTPFQRVLNGSSVVAGRFSDKVAVCQGADMRYVELLLLLLVVVIFPVLRA